MPQMAPMMWQMIYLMTTILLMVMMTKTFFFSFELSKSEVNIKKQLNQLYWKW